MTRTDLLNKKVDQLNSNRRGNEREVTYEI